MEWMDIGDDERSAIINDPDNPGNYKSLRVRPWPNGEWVWSVNEFDLGRVASIHEAKCKAVAYAKDQLGL